MKLQRQLMLVSLLMLIVPWAGCQYVREIDGAIRFGQEQALEATARAVSAALAAEPMLFGAGARIAIERSDLPPLYLAALASAPLLDGYDEEWSEILPHLQALPVVSDGSNESVDAVADQSAHADMAAVAWRAAVWRDTLYLMLSVRDPHVVYFNPSLPGDNGDRLLLRVGDLDVDISTSAPGSLHGRVDGAGGISDEARIAGYWNATGDGYSVELAIPLELAAGRLGVTLIDAEVDAAGIGSERRIALTEAMPMRLVFPIVSLQERLALFTRPGLRLRAVDQEGWLRGDAGRVDDVESSGTHWLLRLLYRTLLADGDALPPQQTVGLLQRDEVQRALSGDTVLRWYQQQGRNQRQLLSAATPVVAGGWSLGAVIAEQSSEPYLLRTDQAFARLLFYSALTLLVTGLGLFGYATLLSQRIRRLSRAANDLLDDDGNWRGAFPASRAQDELGDLSRNYAQLLTRLREYTDYLRTLARKLSHELRTPLAIVHSSLDNLDHVLEGDKVGDDARIYLQRAQEGAQRLSHILTAMSAASRVEESIEGAELEPTRLVPLLTDLCRAYADLYRHHCIEFDAIGGDAVGSDAPVLAAPELIVQMLDKLVENAVDFAPPDSSICIEYRTLTDRVVIEVSNDGPPLPVQMQHQLFDSMVSLRERDGDGTHLGLGLYIVRLIAESHGGRVRAVNRDDGSGVCFRVELPRANLRSGGV